MFPLYTVAIQLLETNANVRIAFQYMNLAMLMQQLHYNLPLQKWTDDEVANDIKLENPLSILPDPYNDSTWYDKEHKVYGKWRPFQIAFVLMNLQSMADKENPEREIVDLIWFPILDEHFDALNASRVNGEFNKDIVQFLANSKGVDFATLYQAILKRANNLEGLLEVTEDISEDAYRLEEYKVLIKNSGSDKQDFHSVNYSIKKYDPVIRKYFKSISLVPKLRETRAFVGFSRLEPNERTISECKKDLRLSDEEDWLPAIEVYGEGIFFEFNEEVLKDWAQKINVKERISSLNAAFHNAKFGQNVEGDLRPEFVLIHTFAHLLINQLSFDCGYGSSSIRERIYCEKSGNNFNMHGLLIYTASGDSEGSLGGLVRQGEHGRVEDTIVNAIKNALWCTSDPICIQSAGQGPESLNLAACHNCALLPETCCEHGNRLLDRGVVVGTLADNSIGFFSELRDI